MPTLRSTSVCAVAFLVSSAVSLLAQQPYIPPPVPLVTPATGGAQFSSSLSDPIDTIDLGSLDVHLAVPIKHKAGRGLDFDYGLTYDSNFWQIYTAEPDEYSSDVQTWSYNSSAADPSASYQGMASPGWTGGVSGGGVNPGYVYHDLSSYTCPNGTISGVYNNFSYVDGAGALHNFAGTAQIDLGCGNGWTYSGFPVIAADGSGIKLNNISSVTLASGLTLSPGSNQTITDTNGNQITAGSGQSIIDTTGTTALTYAYVDGGSTDTTNVTFPAPNNQQATASLQFSILPVATNFGCNGTSEYGTTNTALYPRELVTGITLTDGRKYTFTYEATPGQQYGQVTGRIASITLPSGGTVTYQYGSTINCADGSPMSLTKIVNDGNGHSYIWQFTRVQNGTSWTTTVLNPDGSDQVIKFLTVSQPANSGQLNTVTYLETHREVDDSSGNPIELLDTCYNSSCSNPGSLAYPITTRTVITSLPGNGGAGYVSKQQTETYDQMGNLTGLQNNDFGPVSPSAPGSVGSVLSSQQISYEVVGTELYKPYLFQMFDGSGNLLSKVQYGYDETPVYTTNGTPNHLSGQNAGNVTTVSRTVTTGTQPLNTTITYYDTGMPSTITDPAQNMTELDYGECGVAYPMYRIAYNSWGEPLVSTTHWDCNGGVPVSSSDPNNLTTSYTYDNSYRPATVTDPTGSTTAYTYPTAASNTASTVRSMGWAATPGGITGSVIVTGLNTFDGLGRLLTSQTLQGPGGNNYDTIAYSYDAFSHQTAVTVPYSGAAGQYAPNNSGRSFSYDSLGRMTEQTDGSGAYTSYAFNFNDETLTQGPAPSGETLKTRNMEVDGLGNLVSVCEGNALSGSGNCGQAETYSGFLTKYIYQGGRLRTVIQNTQAGSSGTESRSLQYDLLGRTTSEQNPETGTIQYVYDHDPNGTCPSSEGDLIRTTDNSGVVICRTYDSYHRLTQQYPANGSGANAPVLNFVYDNATLNSTAMQNVLGHLAEAYTCWNRSSCSKVTDEYFSYTYSYGTVGMTTWQMATNSSNYYQTAETVLPNGARTGLTVGLESNSQFTEFLSTGYGFDGEGRVNSVNGTSSPLVSSVVYNASSSATSVNLGNGDSDTFAYDPDTGRLTSYWYYLNGQSSPAAVGALNWNQDGSLGAMSFTDYTAIGRSENCSYLRDGLSRLSSVSCPGTWSQTFAYDPFGNISKAGSESYSRNYDITAPFQNQPQNGPETFDANGNETATTTVASISWNGYGQPYVLDDSTVTYDALGRAAQFSTLTSSGNDIVYGPLGEKVAIVQAGVLQRAEVALPGGDRAIYNNTGLLGYERADWLGSTRMMTSANDTILSKTAYAPFGETYLTAGTADASFTGQTQPTIAGIYDFPFRRLDQIAGRWLQPDPSGWAAVDLTDPQTLNRYAYARNEPHMLIDPQGLDTTTPGYSACPLDNCGQQPPADPNAFGIYGWNGDGMEGGSDNNGDVRGQDMGTSEIYCSGSVCSMFTSSGATVIVSGNMLQAGPNNNWGGASPYTANIVFDPIPMPLISTFLNAPPLRPALKSVPCTVNCHRKSQHPVTANNRESVTCGELGSAYNSLSAWAEGDTAAGILTYKWAPPVSAVFLTAGSLEGGAAALIAIPYKGLC